MATPFYLGSYITCEEYRAAPTALQTNNLVPGALQAVQDAELASLILKASRQIDIWAWQPLYATTVTQNGEQVRIRDGDLILRSKQDRVKQLLSVSWGPQWTSMTALTNPACFIEENHVRVQVNAGGTVWTGSLNLSTPVSGSVFAAWSVVAGWATTRLTSSCLSSDTVITVDNPAGMVGATTNGAPPTVLTLTDTDGATKAEVTVVSVTGSAVTLSGPVGTGFNAGAGVAENEDIKQAAILAVSHYIKARKGSGVVMSKTPTNVAKGDEGDEMGEAQAIAERFQRQTP
jgi:hypothetical protein